MKGGLEKAKDFIKKEGGELKKAFMSEEKKEEQKKQADDLKDKEKEVCVLLVSYPQP